MTKDHTETPELREYRLKARAWLAENVKRRDAIDVKKFVDERTERLQEFKALQQKIFDAGYAGITFPVEYGGQGLTLEHERVFNEEAAGYDMPPTNFGVSINILGATLVKYGNHEQKLTACPQHPRRQGTVAAVLLRAQWRFGPRRPPDQRDPRRRFVHRERPEDLE